MVLEHDRAGPAWVAAEARDGVVDRDDDVLVNRDAVLNDADDGRVHFLAVLENRGLKVDVVALPDGRGFTGVDAWLGDLINAAAVVVLALEAAVSGLKHTAPPVKGRPDVGSSTIVMAGRSIGGILREGRPLRDLAATVGAALLLLGLPSGGEARAPAGPVDATTLRRKVLCGYQGWLVDVDLFTSSS